MQQKIKFYNKYDKSYNHSFASGLQLSSITKDRFDLSFHYEMKHMDEEVISNITSQGEIEQANKADIIEIDRLITTTVSIDRITAENLVEMLQQQLKQL